MLNLFSSELPFLFEAELLAPLGYGGGGRGVAGTGCCCHQFSFFELFLQLFDYHLLLLDCLPLKLLFILLVRAGFIASLHQVLPKEVIRKPMPQTISLHYKKLKLPRLDLMISFQALTILIIWRKVAMFLLKGLNPNAIDNWQSLILEPMQAFLISTIRSHLIRFRFLNCSMDIKHK